MYEYSTYDRIVLENEARCLKLGADKYGRHNWHQAELEVGIERYCAALFRHLLAIMGGEMFDKESGLPHTSHIRCCAGFLEHYALRKAFRADKDSIE